MRGITSAKGFMAAGLYSGIKASGNFDLGVIYCPEGAASAAMFTTNSIVAAPVIISRENVKSRKIYAVAVNSGNANACTGKQGIKDAEKMSTLTAELLGCKANQVLVASTGIIGEKLQIDKVKRGIKEAVGKLADTAEAGHDLAKAIMTTDTRPKEAVKKIRIGSTEVVIAGTAKGAGMIGPNMATTLSFLTTDADISTALLKKALKNAVANSFNRLTVDIHQSTNDTSVVLASGKAGNKKINKQDSNYAKFEKAITAVCDDLARQMAMDAEGVTRYFKVIIKGAASKKDAARASRAIADYPLVKCAVHGGDPNWGRIIAAVGSTNVKLNQNKLSCKLDKVEVFKNGRPVKFDSKKASRVVSNEYHEILVNLGAGKKEDFCYGCDMSEEYVTINADYHT